MCVCVLKQFSLYILSLFAMIQQPHTTYICASFQLYNCRDRCMDVGSMWMYNLHTITHPEEHETVLLRFQILCSFNLQSPNNKLGLQMFQ